MNIFEQSVNIRKNADRSTEILSNVKELGLSEESRAVHILWLYPDVLNLHGGRGDVMALLHVANLMKLPVEIRRCDGFEEDIPFEWADVIYLTSGELKCMPEIVRAIGRQKTGLDAFVAKGGHLWAVASSGAAFGKKLELLDGTEIEGLGLLDMVWKERVSVWGDDLWFSAAGIEVMGNQIQLADIILGKNQKPFGKVIYGRGNNDDGIEGAYKGNVVFTNCLGPMMVKNPRLAAKLLEKAAEGTGVSGYEKLRDEQIVVEDKSFELIKKFIEGKTAKKA